MTEIKQTEHTQPQKANSETVIKRYAKVTVKTAWYKNLIVHQIDKTPRLRSFRL